MKSRSCVRIRISVMILSILIINQSVFSQTKINDGTVGGSSLPNGSAILELESNNKGLLLSRVSLTNTTTWGLAVASPVAGMMIYNTNASIASGNASYPIIAGGIGCYYWDGTGWVGIKMELPLATGDGRYWRLTGNASTSSATNFLGTTDNNPLVFKVNNIKSGYLDNTTNGTTTFGYSTITNNLTASYTGSENTAIGHRAMEATTGGSYNVAVGNQALRSITTGGTNTAVGQNAMGLTQSGWNNTAIGNGALNNNVWGSNNTAVGQTALLNNTADNNTAVGQAALRDNTSGINNVGIGASSLLNNETGNYNIAIGQDALNVNVLGNANVGIGSSALRNTTANSNIAIGQNSLLATTSGGNNTAIGHQALTNNVTGTDNTVLGYNAGNSLNAGGSSNILIGSGVNATGAAVSNTMNIGNTVYATNMNAATRKVGINTNAPTSTLHAAGSLSMAITTTTGNLTLDDTHYTVIITGAHSITLPAAGTATGRIYVIVNHTGANRTVSSYLSFAGAGTTTVALNSSITIQSNGTNWYRIH